MTPLEPSQTYTTVFLEKQEPTVLGTFMGLSAGSAPSKPPELPEPPIALSAAAQTALRNAFNAAGVSDDVAGSFLRLISEHLKFVEWLAGESRENLTAFRALRGDRSSKRHLRDTKRSLDAALDHLAAIKHLPTRLGEDWHAEVEAIHRIRTRLDALSRFLARPGRRGPMPDRYQPLVLQAIATFLNERGLPLVTTPGGLFATVARILLGEVHPRDLMKAIKASRS